ncbi:MAG: DUF1203 domain-containing protein [Rhodoferax sp.]
MTLTVRGIPTDTAHALRHGGLDAHGQAPLRRRAQGLANPCRHCLQLIEEGEEKLVLAYRPFAQAQPYAEVGPIFLHAQECPRYEAAELPAWFAYLSPAVVRGYNTQDWIVYETGTVVDGPALTAACERIFAHPEVAYIHIRSKFNCFQCRVERAQPPAPQ